jgi:hypothetical protein
MNHKAAHPLAGQTVILSSGPYAGQEYRIEDYWDRVTGGSWMDASGNPGALQYAMLSLQTDVPFDDEVLYGKIGVFGHLVHTNWL